MSWDHHGGLSCLCLRIYNHIPVHHGFIITPVDHSFVYVPRTGTTSTETERSSFWWNYHHWQHWKLSKWQLPVQPVMTILSKWRHFRFSVVHGEPSTYVGNRTISGSGNGLSPGRRQAIAWTNTGILLIGPLGTNFSEILIYIHAFSFKKMHLKMSSGKCRPFCLGLNMIMRQHFGLRSVR